VDASDGRAGAGGRAGADGSADASGGTSGNSGSGGAAGSEGLDGSIDAADGVADATSEIVGPTCTTDAQCTGNNLPYFKTPGGYCVECLDNTSCLPDAKGGGSMNNHVCLPATNTCVACIDDTTCSGANTHCLTTNNSCVRCLNDSHCADAGTSVCNLTTHTCGCTGGQTACTTGGGRGGDGAVSTGCFDTQTDESHCGSCNNACNASQDCIAGNCVFVTGPG
jgi:hypothetical protein